MSEQDRILLHAQPYLITPSDQVFCQAFCTAPSLDSLTALDRHHLEVLVAYLFQRGGYIVYKTSHMKDQGVDLIISQFVRFDIPSGSERIVGLVNVKRQRTVAPSAILSSIAHAHKILERNGLRYYYITSGTFTLAAYEATQRQSDISGRSERDSELSIRLIDGERLLRYSACISYRMSSDGLRGPQQDEWPLAIDDLFEADRIHRALPGVTSVLTVSNNKGGVGKTTTTLNLAHAFAALGKRVLAVDTDSQANLTAAVLQHGRPQHTLNDFTQLDASRRIPLADVVQSTQTPRLSLIPAASDMSHLSWDMARSTNLLRFVRDLHEQVLIPADPPYDWVLIDTAPSLGGWTMTALAAAHYVLAPIRPDRSSILGLYNLQALIAALDGLMGVRHGPHLLGCLLNAWRAQDESLFEDIRVQLERENIQMFGPVPYLSEFTGTQFDRAAEAFVELARQLSDAVRPTHNG